jgi:hypothetical protein
MKKHLIFIALLAGVSMSCSQSNGPTTIVVAPYLGELTGRVIPHDVNGDSLPSLLGGTTVVLKGSSFTTTTDSTGQWTLKNVPAGIYRLDFEKQGFDTTEYEDPPAGGSDDLKFSGAGVDFISDQIVVKICTDTIVLDNAVIRDSEINRDTGLCLIMSGHISSNKLQYVPFYVSLDSPSIAGDGKGDWVTVNGKFSGALSDVIDPSSGNWVPINSLASGRKIFVCFELLPFPGYPNYVGTVTSDFSNTIEVTVP